MAGHEALIIGAGIAGLTLAQGLRLRNVPFRIFERQAPNPTSRGHRFRLSYEAIEALQTCLSPKLQDLWQKTAPRSNIYEPRYVDVRDFSFSVPTKVGERNSMPIDRSWLRSLLMLGMEDSIQYGKDFVHFEENESQVHATFADGSTATGMLLVGADGSRSKARKQLQPERRLLDLKRWILYGRTPLSDSLRSELSPDVFSWFMARDPSANAQTVIEPIQWDRSVKETSEGVLPDFEDYMYWAVTTPAPETPMPANATSRKQFLDQVTREWNPMLKKVFEEAPQEVSVCLPILSSKPDIELPRDVNSSRITLIGDAAHLISPMGGAGAAIALQNAADLAETISQQSKEKLNLCEFEQRMAQRARDRIEHSFQNGHKFNKGGEWHEYEDADV